jgi:hypothetical protein
MLMPPQQPQNQPTLNSGPHGELDPNYGFIFNGQQKPRRRFSLGRLPGGSNIAKLAVLFVAGGAILGIIIIVLSSTLFSTKINTKELDDVIARAQEISRVSDLVAQNTRDVNTLNLASTTSTSLTSQQEELLTYLHKFHKKISAKDLGLYLDKTTDTQVQTAASTNTLTTAYYNYLKKHLADYNNSVKTAYNTSGPAAKTILQNTSSSNQVLLNSQQLATALGQ